MRESLDEASRSLLGRKINIGVSRHTPLFSLPLVVSPGMHQLGRCPVRLLAPMLATLPFLLTDWLTLLPARLADRATRMPERLLELPLMMLLASSRFSSISTVTLVTVSH